MLGLRVLAPLLWCLATAAAQTCPSSDSGAAQVYTAAAGTQASTTAEALATPSSAYDFAQERVALEALYNATGGEHWSGSVGAHQWFHSPCYCNWNGVICFNYSACDNSPVIGIKLDRQVPSIGTIINPHDGDNLVGTLPSWNGDPDQGALPRLKILVITANPRLTGTIPEAYGDMAEMTLMMMSNNSLSGSMPGSFGKMGKLDRLYLQHNKLDGTLAEAAGGMTALTILWLQNNKISGTLPKTWSRMTEMEQPYLHSNRLEGALPNAWSTWTKVTHTDMSNNRFSATLPEAWGSWANIDQMKIYATR